MSGSVNQRQAKGQAFSSGRALIRPADVVSSAERFALQEHNRAVAEIRERLGVCMGLPAIRRTL